MNLIKYFFFYYKLTRGRLLLFMCSAGISVFFEMLTASAFLTVLQFGTKNDTNRITRRVYEILGFIGVTETRDAFIFLLFFASAMIFLRCTFEILSGVYLTKLDSMIFINMESNVLKKLLSSEYEYFISQNMGALSNTMTKEIRAAAISFRYYGTIIVSAFFAILYISLPFIMSPNAVIIMMLIAVPIFFLTRSINRKTKALSIKSTSLFSKFTGDTLQLLHHVKYLKSTESYPPILNKIKSICNDIALNSNRNSLWNNIGGFGILPIAILCSVLIIYYQVIVLNVKVIDAITVLGLLYMASQKLLVIPASYQKFVSSAGSILTYEKVLDELSKNQEVFQNPNNIRPDYSGKLVFKKVCFKYAKGGATILKNLNLEILPKSTVAFVGGSGAGKSTIINLITGLLKPTEGQLTLSDTDYRDMDMRSFRRNIGYVTQESVIFNDTVLNNITFWSNAKIEDVIDISKKASAHGFIEQMSHKYDTLLGDHGVNISGGQKQRINIARELLRHTQIFILDEATSALDTETERNIQHSIDKCRGEKTIIIIAHRLSTIKNCDRIFVLDKGEIVEHGTYSDLYNGNGRFRQMVDSQSLN
ncbi:MAG: ABC transporter ATP-binding protein [Lentisphaerota bacterium]